MRLILAPGARHQSNLFLLWSGQPLREDLVRVDRSVKDLYDERTCQWMGVSAN